MKETIEAKKIGNIHIGIFETDDGYPIYSLEPSSKGLSPIVDRIEDALNDFLKLQ